MKSGRPTLICLLGGTLFAATAGTAFAVTRGNPYETIVEHNVFKLRPPAPPVKPQEEAPPSDITLTGITTIFGDKRALLKVKVPARPPHPPKEEYYTLSEGQRDGGIELLSIDVAAGTARVNNHGKIESLIITDAPKLSSATFHPPTPNQPQVVRGPGGPHIAAGGNNIPGAGGPLGVVESGNGNQNSPGANAGANAMPTRDVRTAQTAPNINPAQQMLLMEANREATAQQVLRGDLPPLPPTDATPPNTDPRLTGGIIVSGE